MVRAQTSSKMATHTQVNTKKANQMARANIHGKTVHSMLVSFDRDSSTVRVAGRVQRDLNLAISMKVIILTTKSKDTECLFGLAETLTKVNIKRMNATAMEK